MSELSTALFSEVSSKFFGILAGQLAPLYLDCLDLLEREASQRSEALDRDEALAIIEEALSRHSDLAGFISENELVTSQSGRPRLVLEALRSAGWVKEEQRSDWQRLIHFDSNGTILLQALRKIALPEAAVFSDKIVNACTTIINPVVLREDPWAQIENCVSNLREGLAELRAMQKSIERHTKQQAATSTLKENLSVLFDQFSESVGKTCYAQLVHARLPSRLADARVSIDDLEVDSDLLTKMQIEVMRRLPAIDSEEAIVRVRLRLNEVRELLNHVEPLADAVDRRTAEFVRRSQARFRYLQETTSENRTCVQGFFESINRRFAGKSLLQLSAADIDTPSLMIYDINLFAGFDSFYRPRMRAESGEIEPLHDSAEHQRQRALAELGSTIRDSLSVAQANRFVEGLEGERGKAWSSSDLMRSYIHNDEDMAHLVACLLHSSSQDASFEIQVKRLVGNSDEVEFDQKLTYRVERFTLVKK